MSSFRARPAPSSLRFADRREAGARLAEALENYGGRSDLLVLAIPRGGVPVAFEVARRLRAPLDIVLVRKLGVPGREELAMGAIASGGIRVLNREVVDALGIPGGQIDAVARREQAELERRERLYRGRRAALDPAGRTVILVDDGLATGSTMRAAIEALRRRAAGRIVVAVPVAPPSSAREIARVADEFTCLLRPAEFAGVGEWYDEFSATADAEVQECLAEASAG